MRYEGSQPDEKNSTGQTLSILNFLLIIIIVFCINYMVVNFLFS
jgi:hypothetical protein